MPILKPKNLVDFGLGGFEIHVSLAPAYLFAVFEKYERGKEIHFVLLADIFCVIFVELHKAHVGILKA